MLAMRSAVLLSSVCVLLLAVPDAARAQSSGRGGLGAQLDDPSGRVAPGQRPPTISHDDAIPPPPGAGVRGSSPQPGASYTRTGDDAPSSAAMLTRMRALDASLTALAASSGPDYLRAVLSMLAGGLGIALGAVTLEIGPPFDSMAPYFMVLGGTTILRTVLVEFVLMPDARGPALELAAMPSGTPAQRQARLEYGEAQLARLAEGWMISRIVDGSINIAGALAIIPAYLAPRDFMITDPFEALIFIGPAIAMVGGIITLASPSAAEQRWAAYQELRERLGEEAALEQVRRMASAPSYDFGVAASPEGGLATVAGQF